MKFDYRILLVICLLSSVSSYSQNTDCRFDTSRFAELPFSEMPYKIFDTIFLVRETNLTETEKCIIQKMMIEMFNSIKQAGFPYHYSDYKIQLVSGLDSNGKKFVWVYGFCKHSSRYNFDGWRKYIIRTWDGGVCYFQGLIDLNKQKTIEMSFNGEG